MHIKNNHLKHFLIYFFCLILYSTHANSDPDELTELSVEDLLNIEVISASKKAKSLNDSPAAIFVITQEDIKRIGATSIPEALRLAPGVNVARIDSNKWAISTRGFNGRFANKLLVLIDGRNAYTRTFSGVYWENQDVMLEDIDRIEVIRGPGATLWGANAVNGVINIITKHSADTQGGLLVAGGGTEEQGFGSFRYGGTLNEHTTARTYIKGFKRDENTHQSGGEAGDDWDKVQGGFRIDSQLTTKDNLTIQGDAYRSQINQNTTFAQLAAPYYTNFNETVDTFGGNLLARHQHNLSVTSDYTFQIYYDFYERDEAFIKETRQTIDLDLQHRFSWLGINDVIWGAAYRYSHDDFKTNGYGHVNNSSRNDQLFSAFFQDEITLIKDSLWLTLGSKIEHNDYSGGEVQPTARLMWIPYKQHRIWGAISRAVRTPSRFDHNGILLTKAIPPVPFVSPEIAVNFEGNNQYDSEQVISYELGYRTTFIDNISIDFATFYNDYSDLVYIQTSNPTPTSTPGLLKVANHFTNKQTIQTYGFELSVIWQMLDWWRWDANYNLLKTKYGKYLNNIYNPQQHASLRSSISPTKNFDFDILLRYVDSTKSISFSDSTTIKSYISMDIRLAWQPVNNIELSLVGQNLLAENHYEYKQELITNPTEIDRGMYGKLVWSF